MIKLGGNVNLLFPSASLTLHTPSAAWLFPAEWCFEPWENNSQLIFFIFAYSLSKAVLLKTSMYSREQKYWKNPSWLQRFGKQVFDNISIEAEKSKSERLLLTLFGFIVTTEWCTKQMT